jgi:hypothetical protein
MIIRVQFETTFLLVRSNNGIAMRKITLHIVYDITLLVQEMLEHWTHMQELESSVITLIFFGSSYVLF